MDAFSPFGLAHLIVVAVAWGAAWTLFAATNRYDQSTHFRHTRRFLGLSILLINVPWFVVKAFPEHWNLDSSLPLHLCDFAWMAALASCFLSLPSEESPLWRRQTPHLLLFYWGLGLSPLAFLTPTTQDGLGDWGFWVFFGGHWLIITVALFNYRLLKIRPNRESCRFAIAVSVALFVLVTIFNYFLDTPYFFSGRGSPDNPTPIDLLGPWPWRLLWMIGIVALWFALMTRLWGNAQSES